MGVKEHWQENAAKTEELAKEMGRAEHGMEELENDRPREEATQRERESLIDAQGAPEAAWKATEETQARESSGQEVAKVTEFQMNAEIRETRETGENEFRKHELSITREAGWVLFILF